MNLASELVITHFVVITDTRVQVLTDVRRFRTKGERLRVLNPPCGNLLIVHEESTVATSAYTPVVSKLEA